jgi:hypothetical protein
MSDKDEHCGICSYHYQLALDLFQAMSREQQKETIARLKILLTKSELKEAKNE